ncbi:carboxypeptidase-like regulatory domain-containing protein [Chryseobacterium arthrosphaerae]|uniref:carboxypeptidase-like regulatory domain-containing protein n=2 Tax=Chryseobacterium arthrosphaerae TaxID=651561 RepID=UPI001E316A31|nr:carboxypeptidase-like regulatory domain-containing protein [Chryseobacterium arthrosphaerae]UEQ74628.1 hypothetical protein J8N07_13185 [Chryseobacterium arthrosphaerae]
MNDKIGIKNPCSERWEDMHDFPTGKFCDVCSKNVIDFTEKTNEEIFKLLNGKTKGEICGRIQLKATFNTSIAAAGILLITNIISVNAQIINKNSNIPYQIEKFKKEKKTVNFSGTLLDSNIQQPIANADLYFIQLKKYIKAITDEKGNFSIEIPKAIINDSNIIYIQFHQKPLITEIQKDTIHSSLTSQTLILSKMELLTKKTYNLSIQKDFEIGAVVIITPPPKDYYVFNGKKIGKRKFEKLKKKNPDYKLFLFTDKEAKIIANKHLMNINKLHLLYSD